MNADATSGIVYVLTNPAMPDLVKIGRTARGSVRDRLNELYSTGVPVPFECAYAARVQNEADVERAFHRAFAPYRLNTGREFFQIEPEQAIVFLKLMAIEDVTPTLRREAESVDVEASDAVARLKARRPSLNFTEMGIPIGSELTFSQEPYVTVEVFSDRQVLLHGREMSLSAATKELLGVEYSVKPVRYWTYQGRNLRQFYIETYGES